ncbi:putative bifunctional diguanylate cyclase/phosphodiesterase [Geodermatophilus marinus]|uniref:putative bifunctional diguanylate cyclase/phosphodiesterase n=1 Tax=Geodermatophilus sp. LHW52908 TaxID=2303986 RepID=UPI000E3D5600|nr:GGDEF domain-containing phosphodiesterase [Geodermatophilus sp. LHW52908]RFU19507.1 phosphodiesterase [Geodermatophilus sp. LHW52908]
MPAGLACAVPAVTPGTGRAADLAVAVLGVATAAVVWAAGRRRRPGARGWRLIAVAPLFPVAGYVLAAVAQPVDPVQAVVLRWLPTVPGYLLFVAGLLTLVSCRRLGGGRRAVVELALFWVACLVVVQLLVVGPGRGWPSLGVGTGLLLAAAVLVTSAAMAAALVVLGSVEERRQPMALALLGGAGLLATGRALATSAGLHDAGVVEDVSRFLVSGGLVSLGAAVLLDRGPGGAPGARPSGRTTRPTQLGQLLPHVAMVVAVVVPAAAVVGGRLPGVTDVAGSVLCVLLAVVHRWVTTRDEQSLAALLRRSEAYFRSLVNSSGDAVLILDGDLRVTWAAPGLTASLGAAAAAVTGRDLLELVHPDDVLPVGRALQPGGAAGTGTPLVLRLQAADGTWRALEANVSDLTRDADVGAVVLHCRDVTERLARERDLEQVAFTDPVTGLPNRAGWTRLVGDARAAGRRGPAEPVSAAARAAAARGAHPTCASILLVELHGLDEVREHAGRDVVSTVLVEVGRRLRATVRGDDAVARVGGGAFAVLSEGPARTVDLLADRCLAVLEQPIPTAAGVFDLGASVGVVELDAEVSVTELFARAELAVRAAGASGPGTACRYRPALSSAEERRARLRDDLPGAWTRGELSVLLQPVVSLEEHRVVGVEALLRWQHPQLGEVPPAEFVPIAERTGVIGDLQRWALHQAAVAATALAGNGPPLRLGVNISASHVAARTLVGDVAEVLRCTGLAPERLILEITEATVLADGEYVRLDVEALRLMGVHVALDDFGTGQSSLAHLTRLPIDVLKLDRSFVSRVDRDRKARALCESVVAIGRALGLDVVAEGVETPAQLATLQALGCGFAQGFLLARPMTATALAALLDTGAGVLWPGLVGSR